MFFRKFFDSVKSDIKSFLFALACCRNPGCKVAGFDPCFPWVDELFAPAEAMTFVHTGDLGDILFSLHFCRELAFFKGMDDFKYFILSGEHGLSFSGASFLQPLLTNQKFISECRVVTSCEEKHIRLDDFRKLKLNLSASDIRSWYYHLSQLHLPGEFWKPVIEVEPDRKLQDKILICNTPRYNNVHIDLSYLSQFRDDLTFVGLPAEYGCFCRDFFEVPYQPCRNMLEMAQYMAGAKGFIGNQSGIYSLAECMKIPRILLAPEFVRYNFAVIPGPHNNHPVGGWCENVTSNEKMIAAMKQLLEKV